MTPQPKPTLPVDKVSASKPIDWSDYRDHLATADQRGNRRWVYPKQVKGFYYKLRTWFSWILLAVMVAGPFITINGNPLIMMNIVERKFIILGQIFWPQDLMMLAVAALVFFTCVAIVTTVVGRMLCGWVCPQTVMMEMVFRKIEYLIEGDSVAQQALNRAPWTLSKVAKKGSKQVIFYTFSLFMGNLLLCYVIGWRAVYQLVTHSPAEQPVGFAFMIAFSLLFYSIFARFREQACTFICPYGRFQSALLDENSIIVAYDYRRGEHRAPLKRGQSYQDRKNLGEGDCIGCRQCVAACPAGIDIRDGLQMECVNCTACMDACDHVMKKIGAPQGLIRYSSLNGIEKGEQLRLTPRLMAYATILTLLVSILGYMIFTRSDVQATVLRSPGSLFQKMPDGNLSNLYTLRVINKTSREVPVTVVLESPKGILRLLAQHDIQVPPQGSVENSVLVELEPASVLSGKTPLVIHIFSEGKPVQTLKTSFIGPIY